MCKKLTSIVVTVAITLLIVTPQPGSVDAGEAVAFFRKPSPGITGPLDKYVYLPFVVEQNSIGRFLFNTSTWTTDCLRSEAFGTPAYPPAVFPYGVTALAVEVTLRNATGKSYRLEWTRDGQPIQGHMPVSGTVPSDAFIFEGAVVKPSIPPPPGLCMVLDRGTYQAMVFIDEALQVAGDATIK